MIKVLLLALVFGQAHADEFSGDWHTVAIAADNVDKIEEGGPMRLYIRRVQCREGCEKMDFTFYVHLNGHCQKIIVETKHIRNGVYMTQYEGNNHFGAVKHSSQSLIFYNENVDASGKLTKMVFMLGKEGFLDRDAQEELVEFAASKSIPQKNIHYVLATDVCPE